MLRPNILLLLLDDVRDDVIPLPSLRALARRGTSFTNAHAAGTSCGPSRAALLSAVVQRVFYEASMLLR